MNSFRKDVNGLRAWAVAAVVLFHFGLPGFDGGFVGVDIFFVISGFLMTGIIIDKLAPSMVSGPRPSYDFSLIEFYFARARRILPALMVLCIVLLSVGWFYLPSVDYRMLATHSIAALAFISNIQFWREAGYFDTASDDKLLLHTWSLSVEWQFYLLFPVFLVVLWKIWPSRRFIGFMLLAGFLTSLLNSFLITRMSPSAAFYLLPTRAWEMLAGGMVYLYVSRINASRPWALNLEIVGFTLILASIFLFDSSTPWPSWSAMAPVMGAVLVLLASRPDSLFTGNRVAQWVGKTSYSIYLWHWPFSVALVYFGVENAFLPLLSSLCLTFLFGWASWAYVEQPVRFGLIKLGKAPEALVFLALLLAILTPAFLVRMQEGWPGRLDPKIEEIFAEATNYNPMRSECHIDGSSPVPGCKYGGHVLGVIVIGDSHAQAVIRSVEKALPDKRLNVLDWTLGACPTIFGIKNAEKDEYRCGEFVKEAYDKSHSLNPDAPILIVNRISGYLEGPNEPDKIEEALAPNNFIQERYFSRSEDFYSEMQEGIVETACAFAEYRKVYMLRPIPELGFDVPRVMGRSAMLGREERVSISLEDYEQRHQRALEAQNRAAEQCKVILLDPRPYLCGDERCWGDVEGIPIYYDDDHLSEYGGSFLIPLFEKMFE